MNSENRNEKKSGVTVYETVSKAEYRDLLFARMAGGDLYAMETYLKIRSFDVALDVFRTKPIYPQK